MTTKKGILRFNPGTIGYTPSVVQMLSENDVADALCRHLFGDWGELDENTWESNDTAAENGGLVTSKYRASDGTKFCVVTASDRSLTTVLLSYDD